MPLRRPHPNEEGGDCHVLRLAVLDDVGTDRMSTAAHRPVSVRADSTRLTGHDAAGARRRELRWWDLCGGARHTGRALLEGGGGDRRVCRRSLLLTRPAPVVATQGLLCPYPARVEVRHGSPRARTRSRLVADHSHVLARSRVPSATSNAPSRIHQQLTVVPDWYYVPIRAEKPSRARRRTLTSEDHRPPRPRNGQPTYSVASVGRIGRCLRSEMRLRNASSRSSSS